ncbi:restriction endonuclease [Bacillus safensis]|uniref:nSTAND3 domain-containing NTPase n=1 Tax=Bacillus safensis TaxID=561879 RepID=UPI001AD83815|nr:restriction endonuclease [Bacillus safensis]
MSNYDFHALLQPLEFEMLVCDVVSQREKVPFKTFKEGRDQGIDGFYTDGKTKIIIQVKRYGQQFYKPLMKSLKQDLQKIRELKPDRYILGVSMELTRQQTKDIVDLFKEFNITEHDILDRVELNTLLSQPTYRKVIINQPKLLIPNSNVLEHLLKKYLHSRIYKESAYRLKDACKAAKTFVPSKVYRSAVSNWDSNRTIILSGEPGVGKTTIAQILALAHLYQDQLNGFRWVYSIDDIYSMLDEDQIQVFILDDYWGSILEKERNKKEEERLAKLIKDIENFPNDTRLIITTREYILQQLIHKSPLLKKVFDNYTLICNLEAYSESEKASILYSRLYYSKLNYEHVNYLHLHTDEIVYHDNYNPRVLSLFLDQQPQNYETPEDYLNRLLNYLDCPSDFWRDIFDNLSNEAKFVALLLLITSTPSLQEDIEICYKNSLHYYFTETHKKNLSESLRELEETMIKTVYDDEYDDIFLYFINPSVQDFLLDFLKENCEQWIPKLLPCCSFYNQLLFLFKNISPFCSSNVSEQIIQSCIEHYDDYTTSFLENDNMWDIDILEQEKGSLDRFFDLLRIYLTQNQKQPRLYKFLEYKINQYCIDMGSNDPKEYQYNDLHNLPGYIVSCTNIGMAFNGYELIDKYFKNAFSVFHYKAMERFREIFPKEYEIFFESFNSKIRKNIKQLIFSELDFLDEYSMDVELDILIDSIPDLCDYFGVQYSIEMDKEIELLYGRSPTRINNDHSIMNSHLSNEHNSSEHDISTVKYNAYDWMYGKEESLIEIGEVIELISKSKLSNVVKDQLNLALDNYSPVYIYQLLNTKESLNLLISTLEKDNGSMLPERESHLYMKMLTHLTQDDSTVLRQLIDFCFDSFCSFMYREKPLFRKGELLKSDIYRDHLADNPPLKNIVYKHLIIEDEQWLRFIHIPLFVACFSMSICFSIDDDELLDFYPEIWGENSKKIKRIQLENGKELSELFYPEFGEYYIYNSEWESILYRLFEELKPYHFNQFYVEPAIKRFMKHLGDGDESSKVLQLISTMELLLEYDQHDEINHMGQQYSISDEQNLIEKLGIADFNFWDLPSISQNTFTHLLKGGLIKRKVHNWQMPVYKIENICLLKELGVYNHSLTSIKKIDNLLKRFENGDYSQIKIT